MAIDGESLKDVEFDLEGGSTKAITLKVKDIVLFRLIEKLTGAIRNNGR